MKRNPNQDFFRYVYGERWLAGKLSRANNRLHCQYQEIALDHLDCFNWCSLLECGCGSGELLSRLQGHYPNIQVYGVDLGRRSLNHARQLLNSNAAAFIEGDLVSLPLESGRFDRVLSSSVLWYVPKPQRAIKEMIRVLKPGGRFVFDVRPLYHVTNLQAWLSLSIRRKFGQNVPSYSFLSLSNLRQLFSTLPVEYEIEGYFVLLPTQLPLLGNEKWGNWASFSSWLSFGAGRGPARWLAQKLLVSGQKLTRESE